MRRLLVLSLFLGTILLAQSAAAMPIAAFLQRPRSEQTIYAVGSISMLAFTEGMNGHESRMQCLTDWYKGGGEGAFFTALNLPPDQFKARFGFDASDQGLGYVELVLMRLANDACPAK